jgi:hypothetical protein
VGLGAGEFTFCHFSNPWKEHFPCGGFTSASGC